MSHPENTVWSDYIQAAETLYRTRQLRFRDENRQPICDALGFQDGMKILEIGCGPGAFCHALERWFPSAEITGMDRDTEFIRYAADTSRKIGSACTFVTDDATSLLFPDTSFDATTSHTVVEHVETTAFLSEQYRVLKPGGICTVLAVRTGISLNPESWKADSGEEKDLWDKVNPYFAEADKKYGIAEHAINETELPRRMTAAGFKDVSISFVVNTIVPDNHGVTPETAGEIFESQRQIALDGMILAENLAPGVWTESEKTRLKERINSRFDDRIRLYNKGEKLWDVSASVIMIARGVK